MNLYDEIGVRRVLNASGSMTFLGGSLIAPEVLEAMDQAARSFVSMPDLMHWAGGEIARLTRGAGQGTAAAAARIF